MTDFDILVQRIEANDPTLKDLNFEKVTGNDDDKVIRIARSLQMNTIMTMLDLNFMELTMTAWKAVIEILRINKTVRDVLIRGSNFNLECARLLATALPFCSTLTYLDLEGCDIGINGCCAIVEALCENPSQIEKLDFRNTMTMDSDNVEMKKLLAEKLVLLLQSPYTKLRELNLSSNGSMNRLGDDFVTIFVTGLKHNVWLVKLDLRENDITSVGAMALANAFYYNQTLRELDLSANSIADDGAAAISNALRYHPSMKTLWLWDNDTTEDGLLEMFQSLKYNESINCLYCVDGDDDEDQETASVLMKSIEDYNDTLCEVSYSFSAQATLAAPKKGSGRRQHMFTWMSSEWINKEDVTSKENASTRNGKKRKKNPAIED